MEITSPLFPESTDISHLHTIKVDDLKKQWLGVLKIDISDELQNVDQIDLYRCNQSGLLFYHPISLSGSDKLYEQLQSNFDWYYMPDKWEHLMASQDIEISDHILEVGCGQGYFVQRMVENGFSIEGIEMNSQAVKDARQNNLPVFNKSLQELTESHVNAFDVVCFFQVLEHISDPLNFLTDAAKLLKPMGKLIISVPNQDSFIQYDENDALNMPPHHVTRWSKAVFENLPESISVRLDAVKFEPLADYHVDWYLSVQSQRFSKYTIRGFASRFTKKYLNDFMRASNFIRKRIAGHTLYVVMRKI